METPLELMQRQPSTSMGLNTRVVTPTPRSPAPSRQRLLGLIDRLFSLFGSKVRNLGDTFTSRLVFDINRFISFDPTTTDKALVAEEIGLLQSFDRIHSKSLFNPCTYSTTVWSETQTGYAATEGVRTRFLAAQPKDRAKPWSAASLARPW